MLSRFVSPIRAAAALAVGAGVLNVSAQPAAPAPDLALVNAGRVPPAYPVEYAPASAEQIRAVTDRVLGYLEKANPVRVVDRATKAPVNDFAHLPPGAALDRGDFAIISYEWGVTYAGMLRMAEETADARYRGFVAERMAAIAALCAHYDAQAPAERMARTPLRALVAPRTLDDCGAMSAAMLKAQQAGLGETTRPWSDRGLAHIRSGQKRFADGTLARDRPMVDSLWLDDLYMSVPALAQMCKLTGDTSWYDDAARQLTQFADRMFVADKGLFMHGWVASMPEHPTFFWGRANGWAIMATVELLSALPEDHSKRPALIALLKKHARGLVDRQGEAGLWPQLLDRPSTYAETSASAMFVFALARGINRGWLDAAVYGPAVSLGWNAVAKQVNAEGQVEGTCVGTGMGWDPAFYAYRPTSVYAAHGYGPVLLAGAEMLALRRGVGAIAKVHDGAVHFGRTPDALH